jgi:starvation-inducible DNA-binding protein
VPAAQTVEVPPRLSPPLGENAGRKLAAVLNPLLADTFALYVKTKGFHWHVAGPHFRGHHLLFDDQAAQLLAMVDPLAERVRKLGAPTLRSVADIQAHTRVADSGEAELGSAEMLRELYADTSDLTQRLRDVHGACDELGDLATASLLDGWIDQAEGRLWVLRASLDDAAA